MAVPEHKRRLLALLAEHDARDADLLVGKVDGLYGAEVERLEGVVESQGISWRQVVAAKDAEIKRLKKALDA